MSRNFVNGVMGLASLLMATSAVAGQYKVMPGDRLAIKVFEDEQLSGKFAIDALGNITLPIVGGIKVGGMSLESSQVTIKNALSRGYLRNPVVSISIDEYRPVYIYGQVKSPGVYQYRIGMTPISAIVVAGGAPVFAISGALGAGDALAVEERMRILWSKRLGLFVRVAGIEAQLDERSDLELSGLPKDVIGASGFGELVARERKRLSMAMEAYRFEVDLFGRQKKQLLSERKAIDAQFEAQSRMLGMREKQLGKIRGLSKRGLVRSNAMLEQGQQVAQSEGSVARLLAARSRNDYDVSAIELKLAERKTLFKQTALELLGQTKSSLGEINIQWDNVLKVSGLRRPGSGGKGPGAFGNGANSFLIYRNVDGIQRTIEGLPSTTIEPGDIIEVRKNAIEPASFLSPSEDGLGRIPALFTPQPATGNKAASPVGREARERGRSTRSLRAHADTKRSARN